MIKQPTQYYRMKQDDRRSHPISAQRSTYQRTSFPQPVKNWSTIRDNRNWNFSQPSTFKNNQIENQTTNSNQFNSCKICGRRNHRTIDCFYKRTNGYFYYQFRFY